MVGFVVSHELIPYPTDWDGFPVVAGQIVLMIMFGKHFVLAHSLLSFVYQITGDSLGCLLEFFHIVDGYLAQ